jgi:hypothetical protein
MDFEKEYKELKIEFDNTAKELAKSNQEVEKFKNSSKIPTEYNIDNNSWKGADIELIKSIASNSKITQNQLDNILKTTQEWKNTQQNNYEKSLNKDDVDKIKHLSKLFNTYDDNKKNTYMNLLNSKEGINIAYKDFIENGGNNDNKGKTMTREDFKNERDKLINAKDGFGGSKIESDLAYQKSVMTKINDLGRQEKESFGNIKLNNIKYIDQDVSRRNIIINPGEDNV